MKNFLDGVIRDNEPLIVHRQGAEAVVVISLDDYNAMIETEYLMKSPAMLSAIQKGEEDIQQGRSVTKREGETVEEFLERCIK